MSGSNQDKLEAFAKQLGGDHVTLVCDLSNSEQVDQLVPRVVDALGQLDILVNNAGVTRDNLAMRMKDEEWDQVIKVNLEASFRLMRAAMKPMMRARFGRIISITSVVGQAGNAGQVNYAASKAGLIGFTKALALEVASRGITVNAVAPGLIDTDLTKAISEGAHEEWAARIPLKRLGTPDVIAAAVAFLASDEASYSTGQVLAVNGGMYL